MFDKIGKISVHILVVPFCSNILFAPKQTSDVNSSSFSVTFTVAKRDISLDLLGKFETYGVL